MPTDPRLRLLHGPYLTPKCQVGRELACLIRGPKIVRAISDAPIPWPMTAHDRGEGRPYLIVCGDLARAIRTESVLAICHHWGVGKNTVWEWRKALGVGATTEGTAKLRRDALLETRTPEFVENLKKALRTPERAAKIAAAKQGVPRPLKVIEALRKANLGRKLSPEQRANMSASHRARGTRPPAAGPPWAPEDETLLGTMPDAEVAEQTGRTLVAVRTRRQKLGVAVWKA